MSYYFRATRATKPNDIIALPPSYFNPLPSLHVLSALRYLVCLSVFLSLSHSVSVSLSVSACLSLSLRLSVSLSLSKKTLWHILSHKLCSVFLFMWRAHQHALYSRHGALEFVESLGLLARHFFKLLLDDTQQRVDQEGAITHNAFLLEGNRYAN